MSGRSLLVLPTIVFLTFLTAPWLPTGMPEGFSSDGSQSECIHISI